MELKKLLISFYSVGLIGLNCFDFSRLQLIGDFFFSKQINSLNLIMCSKQDASAALDYFWHYYYKKTDFLINIKFNEKEELVRLKKQHYRIGVFLDLNCKKNEQLFHRVSSFNFFNTTYSWLIWFNFETEILDSAVLNPCSDLSVFNSDNNFCHIQRNRPDSKIKKIPLGKWTEFGNLKLANVPTVRPLDGATLTASLFLTQNIYDKDILTTQLQNITYFEGEDLPNRVFYAIHLHIADLFNYSLQIKLTEDWGILQKNGTFTGMIGDIQTDKANVTIGPLRMIESRAKVADFVIPLHDYGFPFVFKQPQTLGTYRALSLQLTPFVWACVVLFIIISAITFTITQKFNSIKVKEAEGGLSTGFIQFFGTIAQQGLCIVPYRTSSRIICLFMLLFCTMIAIYYNGATMNALLSRTPPSIKTIDDLLKSPIPLAFVDAPYFSNKKVREKMFEKRITDKVDKFSSRTFSLAEGLQLILKGAAFAGEQFWLFQGIEKEFKDSDKCDLTMIDSRKPFEVTSYIAKGSPLRELYMHAFIRMKEHGLAQRELKRWFPKKPSCSQNQIFLFVKIKAVAIALGILLAGIILSFVSFFFEKKMRGEKKKSVRKGKIKRIKKTMRNKDEVFLLSLIKRN